MVFLSEAERSRRIPRSGLRVGFGSLDFARDDVRTNKRLTEIFRPKPVQDRWSLIVLRFIHRHRSGRC